MISQKSYVVLFYYMQILKYSSKNDGLKLFILLALKTELF